MSKATGFGETLNLFQKGGACDRGLDEEYVRVAETSEVPEGTMKAVDVDGEWVAVVNVAGKYYAIGDTCTHEEWSLAGEGTLEGHVITCAGHGAQFDVRTGHVLAPPAILPEPSYEVKVEGSSIFVKKKE